MVSGSTVAIRRGVGKKRGGGLRHGAVKDALLALPRNAQAVGTQHPTLHNTACVGETWGQHLAETRLPHTFPHEDGRTQRRPLHLLCSHLHVRR